MANLKILAAALGLLAGAAAVGGVSAQTSTPSSTTTSTTQSPLATKTVVNKTTVTKTAVVKHRRVHVARHGARHLTVAHKTTRARLARKLGLKHVAKLSVTRKSTIIR